jgi:hypothetical protein
VGGLQLVRTPGTTCGPALDTAELLKDEVDFAPATAMPDHQDLLVDRLSVGIARSVLLEQVLDFFGIRARAEA